MGAVPTSHSRRRRSCRRDPSRPPASPLRRGSGNRALSRWVAAGRPRLARDKDPVPKVADWGIRLKPGGEAPGVARDLATNRVDKGDTAELTVTYDMPARDKVAGGATPRS